MAFKRKAAQKKMPSRKKRFASATTLKRKAEQKKMPSRKKRFTSFRKKNPAKSFTTRVRKVLMKNIETKQSNTSSTDENAASHHNSGHSVKATTSGTKRAFPSAIFLS